MGTSASNPGPRGHASLLPPWADPLHPEADVDHTSSDEVIGEDDTGTAVSQDAAPAYLGEPIPESLDEAHGSWTSPRRLIGNLAAASAGAGGREKVGRALRRAVRAMGGSRAAAAASPSARRTARALGSFLATATSQGLDAAARAFGLSEYIGRGADVFLARLADTLAPDGAETEDAAARAALLATLEELENSLDLEADGLVTLERMSPQVLCDTMVLFFANYIYARLTNALLDHVARRAVSDARVREIERDARLYVREAVRADLPVRAPILSDPAGLRAVRWLDGDGQRLVDRIFVEAFAVLEADLT